MESQQAGQEKACILREDFHLGQPVRFPGQALLGLWLNSLDTAGLLYASERPGELGKPATSTVKNVITHVYTCQSTDRTPRRRHKLTVRLRFLSGASVSTRTAYQG